MTLNNKHGFPVFSTIIEANYVEKLSDTFELVSTAIMSMSDAHTLACVRTLLMYRMVVWAHR